MAGSILTDLTNAVVRDSINTMQGVVMSRPALLVTDGKETTYACDVNVGITTPYPNGKNQQIDDLYGVPGTRGYQVDVSLTVGTVLRNVTIADNNSNLLYADVGNPVIVSRTGTGSWQITGFAAEMPGTRTRIAVNLKSKTIGNITSLGISMRLLTFGEIATLGGGFGVCPLGASGLFIGGVFQRLI